MSALARAKLVLGALVVVAAVALLTRHLDAQISTVRDVSATLRSQQYTVGTDYAGVLVKCYVAAGDQVRAGDPIAVVRSNLLGRDVVNGLVNPTTSPYQIRDGNELVLRAPTAGTIIEAPYVAGAFVPENAALVEVRVLGTTHVEAQFQLTAQEYAQIKDVDRVTVTLPDDKRVSASISGVSVQTQGNEAATRLTAAAPALADDSLFGAGTPVDVTVRLPKDGLLASITNGVTRLLTPASQR